MKIKKFLAVFLCAVLVGELFVYSAAYAEKETFPFSKKDFELYSGVGGWYAFLKIKESGKFQGGYHDYDGGDSGEGYDQTVYFCNYTGKFKSIKKTGEYSYALKLGKVKLKKVKKRVEIGQEERIRYVALKKPYGVEKGKSFILYCPGYEISKLPKKAKEWFYGYGISETQKSLESYLLYNKKTGETFYSGNEKNT